MIFENAYYGETPIYRAYFAGELVWEAVDDVFPRQTLQFSHDSIYALHHASVVCNNEIVDGKQYIVEWDRETFFCTARTIEYTVDHPAVKGASIVNALGNAKNIKSLFGGVATTTERDTGEPFLINYSNGNKKLYCYANDKKSEHTVRIYEV